MAQQLMYVPIQAKARGRPHQTCSTGEALPSRCGDALGGALKQWGRIAGGWAPGDRGREWAEGKEWPDNKEWPVRLRRVIKKVKPRVGGSRSGAEHLHCAQAPGSGCCTCALPVGGLRAGAAGWAFWVVCSCGSVPAAAEELGMLAARCAACASPCSCGLAPLGVRGPAELAFDEPLALRAPRCSPAGAAAPAAAELAPAAAEPAAAEPAAAEAAAAAAEQAAASCFSLSRRRWAPAMAAASSAVPCRGGRGGGVAGMGGQRLRNWAAGHMFAPIVCTGTRTDPVSPGPTPAASHVTLTASGTTPRPQAAQYLPRYIQ